VIIRDTPVMSLSKKKEKVTVEKRKRIDLLSEVALTEEAQYEEVRKKSMRDFQKTHPSCSAIVTSVAKIKPSITNERTDVLEVYMHQFWYSIHKHDTSYRVSGQDFDELPTNEDIVSFFKELGYSRKIKSITDVVVDQMHQPWRAFATIINRSLSERQPVLASFIF
nr:hypothetical protein [Tanacetum cinerariifolium]